MCIGQPSKNAWRDLYYTQTMFRSCPPLAAAVSSALLILLSGCATFSADGGFDRVAAATHDDLALDVRWPRTPEERAKRDARVAALRAHPLAPDDAVQIALLNNHDLQAAFAELGVSEADLVQSGRLPNPHVALRYARGGGLVDIEGTLTFNVVALFTEPYVHATAKRRFAAAQSALIIRIVELADRTRTAYYTALAARDSLHYAWSVKSAAQTSAELAERMLGAGNWTRLEQRREQGFYVQALQELTQAQLADETTSIELNRLLGTTEGPPVELVAHLPELPQDIADLPSLEDTAMQSRIDLKIGRGELAALARTLKLTKATRLVNTFDVGYAGVREGSSQDPLENGTEVSFEVPIFDSGLARKRRAEARYAESVERLAQAAIDARAQVRDANARCRRTFEMAQRQQEDAVPLAKYIAKHDLLRYDASLLSVFDLLVDARLEIATVQKAIEESRDFWIAKSHLDAALLVPPTFNERLTW